MNKEGKIKRRRKDKADVVANRTVSFEHNSWEYGQREEHGVECGIIRRQDKSTDHFPISRSGVAPVCLPVINQNEDNKVRRIRTKTAEESSSGSSSSSSSSGCDMEIFNYQTEGLMGDH